MKTEKVEVSHKHSQQQQSLTSLNILFLLGEPVQSWKTGSNLPVSNWYMTVDKVANSVSQQSRCYLWITGIYNNK